MHENLGPFEFDFDLVASPNTSLPNKPADKSDLVDKRYTLQTKDDQAIPSQTFSDTKVRKSKTKDKEARDEFYTTQIEYVEEEVVDDEFFLQTTLRKNTSKLSMGRRFSSHSFDEIDLSEKNNVEKVMSKSNKEDNTPLLIVTKSTDDKLVMPLKRENIREKLMPNNENLHDFVELKAENRSRLLNNELKRNPSSTKNLLSKSFHFQPPPEETEKDIKIMNLEIHNTALKKENMDLRVQLNYFMQLALRYEQNGEF